MKFLCRLTAVLLLCSFIACNNRSSGEAKGVVTQTTPAPAAVEHAKIAEIMANTNKEGEMMAADSTAQIPPPTGDHQQPAGTAPPVNMDWDKKIIKNANLAIEVKDFKKFSEQMHGAVKQAGGYIAQSEQNRSDYKIENIVTIKVPVDQFDNAVRGLTAGKDNIITQKVTSQDVTGDVIDTRSRLEAKRQVRLRYMDLLKQAKNMEEILQVQKEIDNLQVEMEAAAGKINYLTHSAALSTIELTYYEILNAKARDQVKPSFGLKVLNALQGGLEWLGELLVMLLSLWPLWLLLTGIWWAYKRLRNSKTKTT
jgi:hypothetical protein